MSEFTSLLDRAAGATTCQLLGAMGEALVGYGAISIAASGVGLVPLGIGAAAMLASNYACPWDPNQPSTLPPLLPLGDECWKTTGTFDINQYTNGVVEFQLLGGINEIVYVNFKYEQDGLSHYSIGGRLPGNERIYEANGYVGTNTVSGITSDIRVSNFTGTCLTPGPGGGVELPPPYPYLDPGTGCELEVEVVGVGVLPDGTADFVWKISPAPQTRASGGVISGCNFAPVVYYGGGGGGGGGGPISLPWDDTGPGPSGEPWWKDALELALGGAVAAIVNKALAELFDTPIPQWQYTMRAACNYKQDGSYEDYTITLPEAKYQERMLQLAETQLDFLQQHLLWKTPTCTGGVNIAGDPVTVNFVSDEYSLDGNNVLRKRFVYFDQTGAPLEAHVTHWKDFVWNAGPACVNLEGTPMGKCQVWASTVDEGKRVITHAAAIAGIDVADGEWKVASSRSSRYGQPGTMRVARFSNGNYTVTKRSGPSGNPEACG